MSNNSGKFYPPASGEIAKLLGLEPESTAPVVPAVVSTIVPPGLPAAEEAEPQGVHPESAGIVETEALMEMEAVQSTAPGRLYKSFAALTGVLPYFAVFAVGLVAYTVFFSEGVNINFGKKEEVVSQEELAREQKRAAIAQLKQDESAKYLAWISQFYFDVSDNKILEMDRVAKNGLTNFENYLLQLNPKNYDTLQNGKSDAQNILEGINPKTGQPLSDTERDIIAKYFDLDTIRQRSVSVPPASERLVAGSSMAGQSQTLSPNLENRLDINTEVPARLEIASIGVNTPIIWTKNEADFDADLRQGVVHYPGTPLPGSTGTSYISGHSSNYAWVKADFNQVFAKLNELPIGATFKITVVGPEGKDIWLHYIVERKEEFLPNDQAQFVSTADSVVALSTCWPINTTEKRLVAFGKLNRIEYQ